VLVQFGQASVCGLRGQDSTEMLLAEAPFSGDLKKNWWQSLDQVEIPILEAHYD
jgi:hypothetical protein